MVFCIGSVELKCAICKAHVRVVVICVIHRQLLLLWASIQWANVCRGVAWEMRVVKEHGGGGPRGAVGGGVEAWISQSCGKSRG